MTNCNANATNSIAKPTNSTAKPTNSIAKPTNSIANGTNSIAIQTNSIANGTNSIAKATNSIAKTCNVQIICLLYNSIIYKQGCPQGGGGGNWGILPRAASLKGPPEYLLKRSIYSNRAVTAFFRGAVQQTYR